MAKLSINQLLPVKLIVITVRNTVVWSKIKPLKKPFIIETTLLNTSSHITKK